MGDDEEDTLSVIRRPARPVKVASSSSSAKSEHSTRRQYEDPEESVLIGRFQSQSRLEDRLHSQTDRRPLPSSKFKSEPRKSDQSSTRNHGKLDKHRHRSRSRSRPRATADDQEWYEQEESAVADSQHDPFEQLGGRNESLMQRREKALSEQQTMAQKRLATRRQQLTDDNARWEDSRLMQSGVVRSIASDDPFGVDEEHQQRVQLLVHDFKPPFLDGRFVTTKQQEIVSVVKDSTSDIVRLSRQGSRLVHEVRERQDRLRAAGRDRLGQLSGTRMGDIIGVQRRVEDLTEEQRADLQHQERVNQLSSAEGGGARQADDRIFRESNRFSTHLNRSSMPERSARVSQFAQSKSIREQRQFLPIFSVRAALMRLIREHQVLVVIGHTGSGKTTQMTQYMLEEGYGEFGIIGCTQPRRVAAMSVAKRVSEEIGCPLGEQVGYSIRFEDVTSEKTQIKYMTDGVLLRESLMSPELDRYSAVILDEAHERSINTDVLFGILKQVAQRRSDLKIIVTSATMDAEKFSKFFGGAPIFEIPGRTFPVDIQYMKSPPEDYVEATVRQAMTIHLSQPPGDILIFLTGEDDITATCTVLEERFTQIREQHRERTKGTSAAMDDASVPPYVLLPLYSQLSAELQAKIFESAADTRKIIVSTNVAETSLTVDGVRYVIDCGFCKMKVFSSRIGMDSLQLTPISQANAAQRSGRAGRTGPGVCYRLYTEPQFVFELLPNNIPEIQRSFDPFVDSSCIAHALVVQNQSQQRCAAIEIAWRR